MSKELRLAIGAYRSQEEVIHEFYDGLCREIEARLNEPSNGALQLSVEPGIHIWEDLDGSITNAHLKTDLQTLTGYQSAKNVKKIGLILAGQYRGDRNAFGYMFDQSFNPDSNDPSENAAREGAAVFLNPIRRDRKTDSEFRKELYFTIMHELGHVFNFQHSNQDDFLFESANLNTAPPDHWFWYKESHCRLLSDHLESPNVYPGGSAFEDVGDFKNLANTRSTKKEKPAASLTIACTHESAMPFEPFELDLTLANVTDDETLFLPAQLDPGYDTFGILIENPVGERRWYRSPRKYCASTSTITLSPGAEFKRDISLFGEAGGYTLKMPGVHKLTAYFLTGDGAALQSNTIELGAKSFADFDGGADDMRILTDARIAKTLYHRLVQENVDLTLSSLVCLFDFMESQSMPGNGLYSFGRALQARLEMSRETYSEDHQVLAAYALKQSMSCPSMSDHRCQKADGFLSDMLAGSLA